METIKNNNKNIIVNYLQDWSEDGTHYTQTITIDKDIIKYINKQIKHYHESSEENKDIICKCVGFSKYYDCYLKEIDATQNKYFTNLTQLRFLYYYLCVNNYKTDRILYRNTILKIK